MSLYDRTVRAGEKLPKGKLVRVLPSKPSGPVLASSFKKKQLGPQRVKPSTMDRLKLINPGTKAEEMQISLYDRVIDESVLAALGAGAALAGAAGLGLKAARAVRVSIAQNRAAKAVQEKEQRERKEINRIGNRAAAYIGPTTKRWQQRQRSEQQARVRTPVFRMQQAT